MQAKITAALLSRQMKPDPAGPYEVYDTKTAGFFIRIQPSGVMSYNCQYARHRRKSLGKVGQLIPADLRKEIEEARDQAIEIQQQERNGGYNPDKHSVSNQVGTLKDFIDNEYAPWFKAHRDPPYSNLNNLVPFEPIFHRKLEDISVRIIERWSAKRMESGNAKSTVKRYLNTLKSVLNKAVEWGVIEKSPLSDLKPIKTDDLGRVRFLSKAEEKSLLKALDDREKKVRKERDSANAWRENRGRPLLPDLNKVSYVDHLKPIVLLARNTGMRRGEILSLIWSAINFESKMLTVKGELAKSKKTRHIPLNTSAVELLKKWHKQSSDEYVFPVQSFQKSWKALLNDAGIKDFVFHDLRHDFASRLVMSGADLKTVQELLGHADLSMTLRYSHLAASHKADAVEKLAG